MRIVHLTRRVFLRAAAAAALVGTQAPILPATAAPARPEARELAPILPATAAPARPEARELTLASGAKMPLIGLGTWEADPGVVGSAVQASLDAGCRHLDCAAAYRNEHEVGEALAASGVPREEIFITSKLWNDRRRPADVEAALDKTLSRLGTDYLDLYLIHWPVVWAKDSVMKPDAQASLRETWQTLEKLVDAGKIKHIGVSNYNEAELKALLSYARIRPAVNQIELHPRLPQTQLVEYCQGHGICVTAYSPLGRGGKTKAGLLTNPTVARVAAVHGVSPASVLLRWNLQRGVVVIPKSVTPARIRQNLDEPWSFRLSEQELAAMATIDDGARFCSPPWSTFADRTRSDDIVTSCLTRLASGIFAVASLDITK